MSYVNTILTAMRGNCIYRPCDISIMTGLSNSEVHRVLSVLERGGMVEVIKTGEYRRKKMYKTKQRSFRF